MKCCRSSTTSINSFSGESMTWSSGPEKKSCGPVPAMRRGGHKALIKDMMQWRTVKTYR